VGDALAAIGIALVGQDYAIPPAETALEPGMSIQVVRVTEDLLIEQEAIPFTTIYQPDPDMALDEQRVVQEGVEGLRERQVRVWYEDGLEVNRVVQGEWTVRPPVPRLIAYGQRIDMRQLETPDGTIEYWRKLRLRVIAYSPAHSGLAPDAPGYGLTTSGLPLGKGIVAVDPAVIPLTNRVYVPEYGEAVAADVRKEVQGPVIGLGYDDATWKAWYGWTDVYLLPPVPPADSIPYLIPEQD
jgi:3D (Asp-Asp-Asp) domain-containing protein